MKLKAPSFWTMFWYGTNFTICSKHNTFNAAIKAAKECEKRGGAPHSILYVREVVIERKS